MGRFDRSRNSSGTRPSTPTRTISTTLGSGGSNRRSGSIIDCPICVRRQRLQELYAKLAQDPARNDLIFDDILSALEDGRSPVVITERKDHLDTLAGRLSKFAKNVVVLRGGMGARRSRAANEALGEISDREERVLVATGRYLGEGFDDARLDTLFLTMPISWHGTLSQYAGRLHRRHASKRDVVIYDYVDENEPMLMKMATRREAGYRSLGYRPVRSEELALARPSC